MKRAEGKGREKKNLLPQEQKRRSHCRSSDEECPVETKCPDYVERSKQNQHLPEMKTPMIRTTSLPNPAAFPVQQEGGESNYSTVWNSWTRNRTCQQKRFNTDPHQSRPYWFG